MSMDLQTSLASALLTLTVAAGIVMPQIKSGLVKLPKKKPKLPKAPPPGVPVEPKKPDPVAERRAISMRAFRKSFRRALRRLKMSSPAREYRYEKPWLLMIGEEGTGKTSMGENLGLQRDPAQGPDKDAAEQACIWWSGADAIVLDVTGDFLLRPDGTANEKGWRTLMRLLRRYRYRRPIDGVILAIPATDLIGPTKLDADRIRTKAAAIHAKLQQIENMLGMCVPVFPIITKCDQVSGFRSFCSQVPESHHDDILGWSTPYTVDSTYTTAWVDEAFRSISGTLYPVQLKMMAGLPLNGDGDGLFLFPSELQSMATPLRDYTDQLFKQSSWNNALLMRGLYFTGDGDPEMPVDPGAPLDDEPESEIPGVAPTGQAIPAAPSFVAPPKHYFVRTLFETKIAPEHVLARPLPGQVPAKNRLVLAMQIMMVAIVLLGGFGLGYEYNRIGDVTREVGKSLVVVRDDLRRVRLYEKSLSDEEYYDYADHVLDAMLLVDSRSILSPAMPSSWVSPLDNRITAALAVGFDRLILHSIYYSFEYKVNEILRTPTIVSTIDTNLSTFAIEQTEEYIALNHFVDSLNQFDRHVELYNDFRATGNVEDLRSLVRYLFRHELPASFLTDITDFRQDAPGEHREFDRGPHRERANQIAREMLQRLHLRLFASNPVLLHTRRVATQIDRLARGLTGYENVTMTRSITASLKGLEKTLTAEESKWLSNTGFEMIKSLQKLEEKIRASEFLDESVINEFHTQCKDSFTGLRNDLISEQSTAMGPVLTRNEKNMLALAPPMVELKGAMDELLAQKFMAASASAKIPALGGPGTRLLWNGDGLGDALGLVDGYRGYTGKGMAKFPLSMQRAATNTARAGLEASMVTLVIQAQNREPAVRSYTRLRSEEDLGAEVKSFKGASTNLNRLLDVFSQLQFPSQGDLSGVVRQQGVNIMTDVDGLLHSDRLYSIDGKIDIWDGRESLLTTLFNASDASEMPGYLDAQRDRVKYWANEYVEPVLTFCANQNLAVGTPVYNRWKSILSDLQKYETKAPGNAVSVLETSVVGLGEVTPENYVEKLGPRPRALGTGSFFLDRRNSIYNAVRDRGRDLAKNNAIRDYNRLEQLFNGQIAGRYPFVDEEGVTGQDPVMFEEVVELFALYDQHVAVYLPQWKEMARTMKTANRIVDYLNRMGEVRRFLGAMLDSASSGSASLPVDVDFRVNQRREIGGNQVIDWALEIGGERITPHDPSRRTEWRVGDKVRVMIRWAKDAPTVPFDAGAKGLVEEDGRTVIYTYSDLWSLIRMLRERSTTATDVDRAVDAKPNLLKFVVDLKANAESSIDMTDRYTQARVFLRLGVFSSGKKEKLRLPGFPTDAPKANFDEEWGR